MPALMLLIVVLFFWKLVLSKQYTFLDSGDNVNQVLPWLQAEAAQWHQGHFPLWDPLHWGGMPFPGQVQPGALNPLNWILFSMPLSHGAIQITTIHGFYVFIHWLAVLFAYALCRDLGVSRTAAVLGGCAFGLGGFLGNEGLLQREMAALWLPLILLFFFRAKRGERPLASAAACGAFLGISFLGTHHNVPLFMTAAMAALWLYYLATIRPHRWSALLPVAAFAACFLLIAAAQVLPATELGQESVRWAGAPELLVWDQVVPYQVHEQYSVYPTAVLGIVLPGFERDAPAFIGLTIFTLALIGLAVSWRQPGVRTLAVFGGGALIFALGAYGLLHGMIYATIPGFDKARAPQDAVALLHVATAALAAFGVDAFLRFPAEVRASRTIACRVLLLTGAFLFAALAFLITVRAEVGEEYKFLAEAAFIAILLGALLGGWTASRLSGPAGAVLVLLILLLELNFVTNYPLRPRGAPGSPLSKLSENSDIVTFLKAQPEPVRLEMDRKEIPYNFGDWFGIDQLEGYEPGMLRYLASVHSDPGVHKLLSANNYIGRTPARPEQTPVFEGATGLKVFRNPDALPRLRTVHEAIGIRDDKSFTNALLSPDMHSDRTVLLPTDAPKLDSCEGDQIQVRGKEPARIDADVTMRCRGMLILGDSWFPGWRAYVDGQRVPIHKAYNLVRGVVVEGGSHHVTFRYLPGSVFSGAVLALLGIMLCGALQFTGRRSEAR
jgi:hypothetical protein